jgi:8-amino-7-oxononanoate synthase
MRVVARAGWEAALEAALAEREERGLLRRLRPFERDGRTLRSPEGRELVDFSSNDYLGLAGHPAPAEAAARAARDRGTGATASRLVVGDDPAYEELEDRLAQHKATEAALVVGSGYAANVGVIPALASAGDAIFSDELNHASIVDGCRLARATIHRYRHRDVDHLEMLLRASTARRKLIVSDTVFSMDGDTAPLQELAELKDRHGAALMVDDAHGTGVFGPHGEGYAHDAGVAGEIDVHVGTFSKAFGCYGGFVAGSRTLVRFLHNECRTLIYATALPPPAIAAAAAALELVRAAGDGRRALRRNGEAFRAALDAVGLSSGSSSTQIVPVLVGAADGAVRASGELERVGVLAVAIRPPTVPPGTARLRFSLAATHDVADVERAAQAVARVLSA